MSKYLSETRTEDTILDLLKIQGWKTTKPPKGNVVRQNEYKNYPELSDLLKGKSKTGKGDGYPDFLIVDESSKLPLIVIEAKSNDKEIDNAVNEAIHYAEAFNDAGHSVLAIGIAGQEKGTIKVRVKRKVQNNWIDIVYHSSPITWIPTQQDIIKLETKSNLVDLFPIVPEPQVLAEKADQINRTLREAAIKDEYRPSYVAAMMLALWQSKGQIRKDPEFVLDDINNACEKAFKKANKHELSESIMVNSANEKLANSAWYILSILEKLNVVTAVLDHDYLGQLYETFFRYTGGNTIGQYFTPRHITRFMADICQTSKSDIIFDPACGTGGFLIAAIQRAFEKDNVKYEDIIDHIKYNLIGYESEPLTAALCVANMILRGDGKSGIRNHDVFTADDFPENKCNVVLMNPPFPHKKTDIPPQKFIERALESLVTRGKLAVILPTSYVVKKSHGGWREKLLKNNTLLAVCELPDEVFQPYASTTTTVVLLESNIPHNDEVETVFCRIQYDGLTLKKGVRVPRNDGKNEISEAIKSILNKKEIPGFSGVAHIKGDMEWAPGAYIPSSLPSDKELKNEIDDLMRRYVSFYARYAPQIANQRHLITTKELAHSDYRKMLSPLRLNNADKLSKNPTTIGNYFNIYYGQKELHSRDGIPPGDSLIISPTESYNGTYGWLEFSELLKPPFITVAQTGSIGEAFVQSESCGVNDDCLVLLPRELQDISLASYFICAAVIRIENWRFSYGRKLTPNRINEFKMVITEDMERWVSLKIDQWQDVIDSTLSMYKR